VERKATAESAPKAASNSFCARRQCAAAVVVVAAALVVYGLSNVVAVASGVWFKTKSPELKTVAAT
jgi:hypothetical protein